VQQQYHQHTQLPPYHRSRNRFAVKRESVFTPPCCVLTHGPECEHAAERRAGGYRLEPVSTHPCTYIYFHSLVEWGVCRAIAQSMESAAPQGESVPQRNPDMPAGLVNLGNTCYCSAFLQVCDIMTAPKLFSHVWHTKICFMLPEFRSWILQFQTPVGTHSPANCALIAMTLELQK
jgi:hypothetical protein